MMRSLILLLVFFPQLATAQVDEIILPELDLVIEDDSTLNTYRFEEAVIKERVPQFQEVYLEELSSGIQDSFINSLISLKESYRASYMQFLYGSFNNTQFNAYSKNFYNNFFYKLFYQGQYRDNSFYNKTEYANSSFYNNTLDADFTVDFTNTALNINIGYRQDKISLYTNTEYNQYNHYIPVAFNVKSWINDISYLNAGAVMGVFFTSYQNLLGITTKENLLLDGNFNLSYNANFASWNYLTAQMIYYINDYSLQPIHTGILNIQSIFILGKGFSTDIGFALVGSSTDNFFGWPELALKYEYLGIVRAILKISGDYSLYDSCKASQEQQFFSNVPASESRWIYKASVDITPSPYFKMLAEVVYSDYRNKRLYAFDSLTSLYSFITTDRIGMLEATTKIKVEAPNIFDLSLGYTYRGLQKFWLLFTPHKFDLIMNIGYKLVGFNFEVQYFMYAPRNLTSTLQSDIVHLLNMKISQRIYKTAEIFVEVKNILNQQIQFTSDTFYGGIQANGGVTINF